MQIIKQICSYLTGIILTAIGINHFLNEMNFEKIVPPFIPFPEAAVYVSGAFEIFFELGFLFEKHAGMLPSDGLFYCLPFFLLMFICILRDCFLSIVIGFCCFGCLFKRC